MIKTKTHSLVYAKSTDHGIDIYLRVSGKDHYLVTRRNSGLLWLLLKNGKTLSELSRIRPGSDPKSQKCYHYVVYLLKTVDDFFTYDLAS
jgi:hypothetical protein